MIKLYREKNNDIFQCIYTGIIVNVTNVWEGIFIPYARLFVRLIAIPYFFSKEINWNICRKNKLYVICDLYYIFFKLNYYPSNYFLCRMWEIPRKDFCFYYGSIYDPLQRRQLRKQIHKKMFYVLFEDKYICHQLCLSESIPVQKTFFIDNDNKSQLLNALFNNNKNARYVIKKIDGCGGVGIALLYSDADVIFANVDGVKTPVTELEINVPAIIQEVAEQIQSLNTISPSINTVRVVTLLKKNGDVMIIGAYMRFGMGDSFVDNISSGGIGIGIHCSEGRLRKEAFDFKGNIYTKHPSSGFEFQDYLIPYWEDIMSLCGDIQKKFCFHKLIGHDIAITTNGPVVIELNSEPDMIAMEIANGPMLKNKEIWDNFNEYNLLINKYSKHLYD